MSHDSSHLDEPSSVTMLLVLLLLAHARAEWVEITQPHRNPHRTYRPKGGTTEPYEDERRENTPLYVDPIVNNTDKNKAYPNQSLEKHWNNGIVHRVSNVGHVRRIYLTTEEPASVKYEEIDLSAELHSGYSIRNPFKSFEDEKPQFVTKEETFDDDDDEIHFVRKPPPDTWSESPDNKVKNNVNKTIVSQRRVDTEKTSATVDKKPIKTQKEQDTKNSDNDPKVNTMENVLKFVKVVADTISRNTRRSFSSKVKYLEDLKETIMVNIEDRIESLFPDDAGSKTWRRREAESRGHGYVDFPSSESALMTISFLTFAVYLIKLILQVIQTYKNKTMMMMPAVVAAMGRTAGNKS